MIVRSTPCNECAFSRICPPGLLGGSPVETYIGQTHGPFLIPCHKACNFKDPAWKDRAWETIQCAGAAIFRTHLGVAERMPPALSCLPASQDVFATPAEFMAHHDQIPLEDAQRRLAITPPSMHLSHQLQRVDNRIRPA